MKPVFDLVGTIYEEIAWFLTNTGRAPLQIVVSPASYRRLLELREEAPQLAPTLWTLDIVIDEVLPDTEVEVAG